jgi:hypothetical protein
LTLKLKKKGLKFGQKKNTQRGNMKVSKELADVLKQASEEVEKWPQWKRSLDPIGDKSQGVPPYSMDARNDLRKMGR